MVKGLVLTSVHACVECGMMQPSGFRGGTPVQIDQPSDTERAINRFGIDAEVGDIPDYIDERYRIWLSRKECPVCGNNFYHRLDLPNEARLDAIEEDEEWHFWGDL